MFLVFLLILVLLFSSFTEGFVSDGEDTYTDASYTDASYSDGSFIVQRTGPYSNRHSAAEKDAYNVLQGYNTIDTTIKDYGVTFKKLIV